MFVIERPFFAIYYILEAIQQSFFYFSFFLSLPFIDERSFFNVNGRASEEDIEDLEDLVKSLTATLTAFETTIIG